MVIIDFIQRSPNCQTTLEFHMSLKNRLSAITMTPPSFCNHGQLELRTIKTKYGSHHVIIFPNAIYWYIGTRLGL